MTMQSSNGIEPQSPPGAVELREDVPLKAGGGAEGGGTAGGAWCAGGPRLILICFAALSAAITLALFTQIYYGDYEVVPHGSVASSAERCSRAGTDALKRGGRAMDAAVAAALCLAIAAPHRTSLDASGSMLYWEYRQSRTQSPMLAEWGAGAGAGAGAEAGERPPRLVAALAALHAELGALPWSQLLQPAVTLAKDGFPVSEGLAAALGAEAPAGSTPPRVGSLSTAPQLARYLGGLQRNTSVELAAAWGGGGAVRSRPAAAALGAARLYAGGDGAAARALVASLHPPPLDSDEATRRVVSALQLEATTDAALVGDSVASGLAVVDSLDTYLALVTGLSVPFGSGPATTAGWTRDEPARPVDLAPAIMIDRRVCGTRYVVGAESTAALAQAAVALWAGGAGGAREAVERARVAWRGGAPAAEAGAGSAPGAPLSPAVNASRPYAAVNLVQQTGDDLLSYADSRGGGIASRF